MRKATSEIGSGAARLRLLALLGLGVLAVLAVALSACGSTDNNSGQAEAADEGPAGGQTLEVKLDDYSFNPKNATVKAGSTVIETSNDGAVVHELVLFKTDTDPAKLPTEPNGEVNEEKLEQTVETPGEIADVDPGKTKSGKFELTPGTYVMFCNVPGHYAASMYGTLTVTK